MAGVALVIGVDDYPGNPLTGCVADAEAIAKLLQWNADGGPNLDCRVVTSENNRVTRQLVRQQAQELFSKSDADVAVFFFAGHGAQSERGGVLVTQDSEEHDEGVLMSDLIGYANRSEARERIIILDCCHAGEMNTLVLSANQVPVPLEEGVTILAACRSNQFAIERGGRGLFTGNICDALDGGAADVRGRVSVADVYAYVNEVFAEWDQKPLFRASLAKLTCLRRASHAVSDDKLRRIVEFFPTADAEFALDPSFEPTEEPRHEQNEADFALLQALRAARILEPVGTPHMYYAAMESRSCKLTPRGQFYWRAASAHKF
jgi:hypothetical protein